MIRKLTRREEIAWAAGLYEGEGSAGVYRRSKGAGTGVSPRVSLGMTDRDTVERFAEVWGIGTVRGPVTRRDGDKPMWEWTVRSRDGVIFVLGEMLPYLHKRRRLRAWQVLQAAYAMKQHNGTVTHCPSGHEYTGDNLVVEQRKSGPVRRCRTCDNTRSRERQRRYRAERRKVA